MYVKDVGLVAEAEYFEKLVHILNDDLVRVNKYLKF